MLVVTTAAFLWLLHQPAAATPDEPYFKNWGTYIEVQGQWANIRTGKQLGNLVSVRAWPRERYLEVIEINRDAPKLLITSSLFKIIRWDTNEIRSAEEGLIKKMIRIDLKTKSAEMSEAEHDGTRSKYLLSTGGRAPF